MKPIISVRDLGKMYRIRSEEKKRYLTLRDELAEGFRKLWNGKLDQSTTEEFWALKDINFDIYPGEVVGIIGRNGAGKSTLLKILSRITPPTKGEAILGGRVGSLLEVGTGFHPELTGRENIYLSGAILGMTRAEIKRKFDEIVAFADIEKFIDTPVKRYSSGMYVRLAFGVAAHLEPEILIVDEVLAVGDAQFQKKCLGKMGEVAKGGRTVLFVSHSMPMITSLCPKCILLDAGRISQMGSTSDLIIYYFNPESSPASVDFTKFPQPIGDEYAILLAGSVNKIDFEKLATEVQIQEPIKVQMKYRILQKTHIKFVPNFHFYQSDGTCAFVSSDQEAKIMDPGDYIAECRIPGNFLNEGVYFVGLALSSFESTVKVHFYEKNTLSFNVKDPIEGTPGRNGYIGPIPGVVRPQLKWNVAEML
ncbi:ABC transporter ATP-binding protein [Laspinema sp. D2d]|uniref:ABC transporter ATP-binding protein n=1 Tax=Laspinema sp. D2d TaxID=2953686 RepID=UPI00294FFBE7|nr:ABC transporter ATP-binding protein [Laspinema sp. D2d]